MKAPAAAEQLSAIVAGSDDAIISTDLDGTITAWSRGAELLYGYSASEALGRSITLVYLDDNRDEVGGTLDKVTAGEPVRLSEEWRRRADGSLVLVELRISPMVDRRGMVIGCSAIVRDVSDRVRREQELEESRSFLEKTQAIGHIGSFETRIGPEAIMRLSPEAYRLLGIDLGRQLRNYDLFRLVVEEDRQVLSERVMQARTEQVRTEIELRLCRPDGSLRWAFVLAEPLLDETGSTIGLRGLIQDVTEAKRVEERLRHDALHERLTGLPNRLLLLDRLAQTLARSVLAGTKVAVCCLDLDRFKLVNDTKGHTYGDELLRAVADRLVELVGSTGTVAHLGADEFVVVREVADTPAVLGLASELVEALRQPFAFAGGSCTTSASVGIAVGGAGSTAEALARDADLAVYQAKLAGRDRFQLYDLAIRQQAERRMLLEEDLRRALGGQQLYLVFQPMVSLADGRVVGVEALARWRHPVAGLVLPERFVPVAEDCGLIGSIGHFVLDEACRVIASWQAASLGLEHLRMSVNVSAAQLVDGDFPDTLAKVLATHGLSGSAIEIELTESVLIDGPQVTDTLEAVKALGARVSIDDFGTGYSSLSYLTRLPIDGVKVDRSFVSGAEAGSNEAVVGAVAALGRALGLQVVAEGVEDAAQLATAKRLGCDVAQGYFLWPPLAADECLALFTHPAGRGGARRLVQLVDAEANRRESVG